MYVIIWIHKNGYKKIINNNTKKIHNKQEYKKDIKIQKKDSCGGVEACKQSEHADHHLCLILECNLKTNPPAFFKATKIPKLNVKIPKLTVKIPKLNIQLVNSIG